MNHSKLGLLLAALLVSGCDGQAPEPLSPVILFTMGTPSLDDIIQTYSAQTFTAEAGKEVTISLQVLDLVKRKPVEHLTQTHGRYVHTFIVSADLKEFYHLHHEDFAALTHEEIHAAVFHFPFKFNRKGKYYVISQTVHMCSHHVENYWEVNVTGGADQDKVVVDKLSSKTFGDYKVGLTTPSSRMPGGVLLNYDIATAAGTPLKDLQLYIGEEMHVFTIREDGLAWVHAHPEPPGYPIGDLHGCREVRTKVEYNGPNVPLLTHFPSPGNYKVFGTFQHKDKSVLTDFWMKVDP